MIDLDLIITQGPYSSFLGEVAAQPHVSGIRLNTVMPIKEGRLREKLAEMRDAISPRRLWIDLKARQLRIREFANTPYTAVTISHRIKAKLPTLAYFDNGNVTGKVVDIDGHKLILEDYVGRLLGPGEAVNIVDDSLEYLDESLLTERDVECIDACRALGIDGYMLSFVEDAGDVEAVRRLHPGCEVMAKVENRRGLARIDEISAAADLVMAARGDLYSEIEYPHRIARVMRRIVEAAGDRAVAASRFLESILRRPVPACADMMDIHALLEMGYRRFMIGDDLCFKREVALRALRIFASFAQDAR